MTNTALKALAAQFPHAVNQHDLDAAFSLIDDARLFLNTNYASFPWTNDAIEQVIVDGDRVTVILQIEGEHTGVPCFGRTASGKCFKVQCIEIQRIPGEHFLEHWGGMDFYQWIDSASAEHPVRGINVLDAQLGALRRAFHDLHLEVETSAAQEDKVSVYGCAAV